MLTHAALAEIAGDVYRSPWSATVAGDVHYAMVPRGREVVVCFPGTHPTEALDWIRDFRFWPVWRSGLGLVHAGFGRGACAAWRQMKPELGVEHDVVTFAGHSLGGALAACLAALHAYERPGVAFRVVTFGQPRVAFCNPWFGHLLNRGVEHVHYRRRFDLVPQIPPRPYLHGGRVKLIGRSVGDAIADHAISLYAADLKAMGV